jgi:hypothetical protein
MNLLKVLVVTPILLVFFAFAPVGYAETTTASLSGSAVDPQHAALSGAVVTATEQGKNFHLVTHTDSSGRFVFPQLPPGIYNIKIQNAGFQTFEQKAVTLNANDKLSIGEVTMIIGQTSQVVEVTATAAPIQLESAERSDALVGQQLQNVAVNSRSYLDLVKLVPGVVSTVNLQTAGTGGLGSIAANGARANQNQLTINGIGDVDTGSNTTQNITLSLDSIQEFKILTSAYQAEYGRSSGAQISVVTKSGSSDFHGSGYWFHRHEGLNANNWMNNFRGLPRRLFRFNDLGYTFGGPVYIPKSKILERKDKLFFFWSQEFQEQLRPENLRNLTVPTALERQGDFSQSVDKNGNLFNRIRDPLSGLPCTATNASGCFASGGVLGRIPQNRLYGPGVALLNMLPTPNALGNKGFNFQSQISDSYPRREDLLRLDYNMSDKSRFFLHRITNNNTFTSEYGAFVLGSNTPITPVSVANPGYSWAFGNTYSFSSTLINEVTVGWSNNSFLIAPTTNAYTRTATGATLPVLFPNAVRLDLVPNVTFGGTRIGSGPNFNIGSAPFTNYNTTIDVTDNLSKVINNHTLKTGVYLQRSRKNQSAFADNNGNYDFGDNGSNPFDTGFGFSNAAIGVFNRFDQASGYIVGQYRYWNIEGYVQDTWKVNRRLTLDYGLRLAWYQPQYDASLQGSTFLASAYDPAQAQQLFASGPNKGKIIPGSGNPLDGIVLAGQGGVSQYLTKNRGPQWGPRAGLAWDITGKQQVVFHAGGGVYYDRTQGNNTAFFQIQNPPVASQPVINFGFANTISPTGVAAAGPPGLQATDTNGKIPTTYSYTTGLQVNLPYKLLLDTAYVGSISNHQADQRNLNAIPYGATFLPQNWDPALLNSSGQPKCALPGCASKGVDFLRPFPGYGDITLHENASTANYNALQVSLNRRVTRGLFLGAAYTWSKALGTATADGNFIRIDGLTRLGNYGPTGNDRRHNFVVNYVYEVAGLHSGNFFLHGLTNGWQVSGFVQFQSGSPFSPGFSISGVGNQNLTGSFTEPARLALVGNPKTGTDNPFQRLNPAAFAAPIAGSRGLEGPSNYLTNPGINNSDMSLQKSFGWLGDRGVRLRLRVDAFNVFNHTQFSGINSTLNFNQAGVPQNLAFDSTGKLVNPNGFGTVNGARDPRVLQTQVKFEF